MKVDVEFDWTPVGELRLDVDGKLAFPTVPDEPGAYRFELAAPEGKSVYIGEADRLRRRFAHYRNPGPRQSTNIRINAEFKEALGAGQRVQVSILTKAIAAIDGGAQALLDLRRESSRRLVENAALAAAYLNGADRIINASRFEAPPIAQ